MNSKILIGASLVALTGLGGLAFAGSSGVPTSADQKAATVEQLQVARDDAARRRQLGEHGMLYIQDTDRQSKLDRLIQRLQNGEAVSPDDIDNAKR